jgi:hypothetical protein
MILLITPLYAMAAITLMPLMILPPLYDIIIFAAIAMRHY